MVIPLYLMVNFCLFYAAVVQLNNVIILSWGRLASSTEGAALVEFATKYRQLVDPRLLFVSVDIGASSCGFVSLSCLVLVSVALSLCLNLVKLRRGGYQIAAPGNWVCPSVRGE